MRKNLFFIVMLVVLMFIGYENVNAAGGCASYSDNKNDCILNNCSWNADENFCSPTGLSYLTCGDIKDIPSSVPGITSLIVNFLKTVAPIILIIVSVISLVKSITAGKEDEIKKAQTSLIKRIIAVVLVFFVISIVQLVMFRVSSDDNEHDNLSDCLSCFLNGKSKCGDLYYKDGYGYCYWTNDHSAFKCDEL